MPRLERLLFGGLDRFPEVSGLLEQIIAHAAALEPIFAERLRQLPYLP